MARPQARRIAKGLRWLAAIHRKHGQLARLVEGAKVRRRDHRSYRCFRPAHRPNQELPVERFLADGFDVLRPAGAR
jgi:hypothetical protein